MSADQVSGQLLQRLQSVQNAAARLVTGARRSDRVTPILRHCIGYQYASELSSRPPCLYTNVCIAWLRHTCRHIVEPTSSHGGRRHQLRSAESGQLTVPRTKTTHGLRRPQFCRLRTSVEQSSKFQPNSVCWTFHSGND